MILLVYLCAYALFGILTIPFYPSYAFPYGDEGTYLSYARNPWTLMSEFFEGYRPKEVMNPYNFRLFLTPFSLVFATVGFTHIGARVVVLVYGLVLLALTYGIGAHLGKRPYALLGAVLLSLSPQFLFFTHGIRPEGLMAVFILLCLWLTLRRTDGPQVTTYGAVAFLSAATLMVHYNGAAMPVVLLATLAVCDWGRISRCKILALVLGTLTFGVAFLVLNILPAWATLREFGVLPVTFSSSNRIPILQSLDVPRIIRSSTSYYLGFVQGRFVTEPDTPVFTTALLIPAFFGVLRHPRRPELCVATLVGLLAIMLLLVFPNRRPEYVYYLCPLLFILAAHGLSKVPGRTARRTVVVLTFVITASAYVHADTRALVAAARYHPQNRRAGAELRAVVEQVGGPGRATVMGAQEFHVFVPDVAYRTFHSLITTQNLSTTLQQIDPNVVIIHPRAISAIGSYLRARRPGVSPARYRASVRRYVAATLGQAGFSRYASAPITWNGERVDIYYRR